MSSAFCQAYGPQDHANHRNPGQAAGYVLSYIDDFVLIGFTVVGGCY